MLSYCTFRGRVVAYVCRRMDGETKGQDFEILRCKRERAHRKNSIIIFRSTKCGDNTRLPYFCEVLATTHAAAGQQ